MEYKMMIFPKCRTCKHEKPMHYRLYGMHQTPPFPCNHTTCRCKEFLPTDNLEYLEYKNERCGKTL